MQKLKSLITVVGIFILGFVAFSLFKVHAQSYKYCTNCSCPTNFSKCISDGETTNTCTNWSTCNDPNPPTGRPSCCNNPSPCNDPRCRTARYYCTQPYANGSCSNPSTPPVPGNPPQPPPPPACTPVPPSPPVLLTPPMDSVQPNNSVTVTWAPTGAWGVGCPDNWYEVVFISPDCTASYIAISGVIAPSTSTYTFNNLDWGRRYCWTVGAYNNAQVAYASPRAFYINQTPTLVNNGFTNPDTCDSDGNGTPNGVSGRVGQPNATNPVTYTVTFRDTESDTFEEIWLAFVPNVLSAQLVDRGTVEAYAGGSGSIAVRLHRTGVVNILRTNATWGSWVSAPASNEPNSATLLSANFTRNGIFATGTFTIQFNDNFPYGTYGGNYNIYSAALMVNTGGTTVTSYATPDNPFVYFRTGAWRVDVNPPSVFVSNPTTNPDTSFNVQWSAGDAEGPSSAITRVWSYIYADRAATQVRDNTIGLTINPPNSVLDYPTASNAGVTVANLSTHNYNDLTPALNASYSFRLVGQDFACNISRSTASLASPIPWLITHENSISAGGGYNGFGIPNLPTFTIPFTSTTGVPYLTTYSAFSGNGTMVNGGVSGTSRNNQIALNYQNLASNPPLGSGTSSWYQYLLDLVSQNGRTTISASNTATISGNLSTSLGVPANTKRIVTIAQANVVLESNATCDIQAMIFISGNLTIRPDFNFNGNNRCMFIAGGNITIENGSNKTNPPIATNDPSLAQYDIIRSILIASGEFRTTADTVNGNANKWDGLYVNGSVIANQVSLRRNLNLSANAIQPAHVFTFDPVYMEIFGGDLSRRDFSIREVGR